MRDGWREVELGEVLTPIRRRPTIDPDAEYKLVTLPVRGAGARLRSIVKGRDLGTAKYEVRAGDLMISKIDARKGSNSLLPTELDGAIVTGDFLSYEVDVTAATLDFMDLFVRRPEFEALCDMVSSGSTNRVRLDPARFLQLRVSLPPLAEQRRIVDVVAAVDDAIDALRIVSDKARQLRRPVLSRFLETAETQNLRAGDLISAIEPGKSPRAENRPPTTGEYGVLKVSAVNPAGFRPSESKRVLDPSVFAEHHRVRDGDVLITRANTAELVGAVCRVETTDGSLFLCDKTLRLVPKETVGPPSLVAALNTTKVRKYLDTANAGSGANMKNISQPAIRSIPVDWPFTTSGQQELAGLDSESAWVSFRS